MRSDTLEVPTVSHYNTLNIHCLETATPTVAMSGGRKRTAKPKRQW
jgi:hypothetical protein